MTDAFTRRYRTRLTGPLFYFYQTSTTMSKPGKISVLIQTVFHFLTKELWRAPVHQSKGIKNKLLNLLRTLYLAGRGFVSDRLNVRASALTYTTLLAVV